MKKAFVLFAMLAAAGMVTDRAAAQAIRTATVRAGGLMYDRGGDQTNLMLGGGVDWALSRHVIGEVEGSWSSSDATFVDYTNNPNEPIARETSTHLATVTAGVQAQAVLGPVRPYIGVSGGLFMRYDENGGGDRFLLQTFTVPGGLRIHLTDRLGLRAELRARFDTHQDGGSGFNLEQTVGVSLRF